MTCAEFEVILCDYIDGTLSAEARSLVESHRDGCEACAQLAGECGAMAGLLASVPQVAPPAAAVTRILQQIPARQPAGVRAKGMFAGLLSVFAPVRQPRVVMGMAMTILSFAMLGRFAGIEARQLRPSDLHPARVAEATEDKLHRAWARAVKYYENLRFVYEIQSRLRELTASEEEESPATPAAAGQGTAEKGSQTNESKQGAGTQ